MPIVGKFFPSQKSQEKVFLLLRRHWFTYFGFVFIAFIMSIPVFALLISWYLNPDLYAGPGGNLAILGVFAYLLTVWGVMLYGFIDYYLDVYIITNERIVSVEQNGFFKREISELHLHQIQDVSARVKGIFPTLIHYGDVFIQTAGERENFIFKSVPNPYRVSKLIVDLHEAQIEDNSARAQEEQKSFEEFNAPETGKIRDMLDLENVDPAALSIARKRTKEFLAEDIPEEADLKSEVDEKLSEQKYHQMLDGVDLSEKEPSRAAKRKAQPAPEDGKKASDQSSKKPGQSGKTVAGSKEGEMHENEEIDF